MNRRGAAIVLTGWAAAALACGAFSGSDVTPDVDGGGDASPGTSDVGIADTSAEPVDAGPQNVSCAKLIGALFCADFEHISSAPFGFDLSKTDDSGALAIEMGTPNGAPSNVLKATIDTSGIFDAAPHDTFVHSILAVPASAKGLTLEFDFKVASDTIAYASFGDIYAPLADSLGVGANLNILGQPYDPHSGVTTLMDTGQWHHARSEGHYDSTLMQTTIDGVLVQNKVYSNLGLSTRSPQLSAGIYGCAKVQDLSGSGRTTVYVDNVVVRVF